MFIIQCPILWYAKVCALPSARSSSLCIGHDFGRERKRSNKHRTFVHEAKVRKWKPTLRSPVVWSRGPTWASVSDGSDNARVADSRPDSPLCRFAIQLLSSFFLRISAPQSRQRECPASPRPGPTHRPSSLFDLSCWQVPMTFFFGAPLKMAGAPPPPSDIPCSVTNDTAKLTNCQFRRMLRSSDLLQTKGFHREHVCWVEPSWSTAVTGEAMSWV